MCVPLNCFCTQFSFVASSLPLHYGLDELWPNANNAHAHTHSKITKRGHTVPYIVKVDWSLLTTLYARVNTLLNTHYVCRSLVCTVRIHVVLLACTNKHRQSSTAQMANVCAAGVLKLAYKEALVPGSRAAVRCRKVAWDGLSLSLFLSPKMLHTAACERM